jgi:hypothetical protein
MDRIIREDHTVARTIEHASVDEHRDIAMHGFDIAADPAAQSPSQNGGIIADPRLSEGGVAARTSWSRSPLSTRVRVCRSRCAPRGVQRMDCRLNYGESFRAGERISTGFVESAVNQIVDKRFVPQQPLDPLQCRCFGLDNRRSRHP